MERQPEVCITCMYFYIKNSQLTGGLGTSKRGYNAKKRSEAAQIAAQNGISYPLP